MATTSDQPQPRKAFDELSRATRVVAGDAQRLQGSVEHLASDVTSQVREAVTARPYASIGVAAGIGFVLAGGLSTSLARTAFRIGTRIALTRALASVVASQPEAPSATP
ncbi:MAG: hypothetical protein H6744_05650 [Deltaproteobacteria bacterium]|nr:hypothetical protein [Deltaproteobacteria bacterium]MCB9786164.1 hypothetical protein [Deltaproteobacteria bacterium]